MECTLVILCAMRPAGMYSYLDAVYGCIIRYIIGIIAGTASKQMTMISSECNWFPNGTL